MRMQLAITILFAAGLFLLFEINPFALIDKLRGWRPPPKKEGGQTAAEFVRVLEGKKRDNLIRRSLNDARTSLITIGQERQYIRTLRLSAMAGVAGGVVGIFLFSSPLLFIVLGLGCGLVPLWLTNLKVYAYQRRLSDELETALSLVTQSYIRHNDIVKAAGDNIEGFGSPMREVFGRFVATVNYINGDIEAAISQMKADLDNTLFHQWCDILLLCQNDHTLQAGLRPIVEKISHLKAQQDENETLMMRPLRDTLMMVGLVLVFLGVFYFMSPNWYGYLIHTFLGQLAMCGEALIVFWSLNKAIKLSKPIDYRI